MIDPRSPSERDRAEFARLLDTYGAERRRWPEAHRALYDSCAGDKASAELLRAAADLDEALGAAADMRADDPFKERLLAGFSPPPRRTPRSFGRWLKLATAGALAALSAMGFVVGSATAGTADEALYYAEAAMEPSLSSDAGLWTEGR